MLTIKLKLGLKRRLIHGGAATINTDLIKSSQKGLQILLSQYSLNGVFNADETGLFYRLLPNNTLASCTRKEKKKLKDRITILISANVSVQQRIPYRCFGRNYDIKSLLGLRYGNSANAWITQHLFTEWLQSINECFKSKRRRILLLIDNAPSHKWNKSLTLDHVLVQFIPPNMTAHIRPMAAGIIVNFKSWLYLNHLVKEFDKTGKFIKINLKDALDFVLTVWDSVESRTIFNCWRATGILPCEDTKSIVAELEKSVKLLLDTIQSITEATPTMDP